MVVWFRRFDIPLFYKIFSHRPRGINTLAWVYILKMKNLKFLCFISSLTINTVQVFNPNTKATPKQTHCLNIFAGH